MATEREKDNDPVEEVGIRGPAEGRARRPEGAGYAEGGRGAAAGDQRRRGGRRRRVCIMCADKIKTVDYKNIGFLRRFVSDRARIETRRKSSACAKHQRSLARAIKRARHLALIPYTAEHIRSASVGHR
jgi:small subunit ribosomal protein S18